MTESSIIPEGENLRRAIQWLGSQARHDAKSLQTASVQFDLSPLETAFLYRHFNVTEPNSSQSDC